MGKRIAVVGVGALGGYVGGNLAHSGEDVTLIGDLVATLGLREVEVLILDNTFIHQTRNTSGKLLS